MKRKGLNGITRRSFLESIGVTAAALTLSGVPTVLRSEEKNIEIAAVDALTGRAAKWGASVVQGEELAIEEINQAGGIKSLGGAKLKLTKYDTESKVELGVTATQRAVQKGAKAILGCAGSSICLMVTQIAEREKIPMLIAQASDTKIMQRGFKYIFRVAPLDEHYVPAGLAMVASLQDKKTGKKVKTIAHLFEDSAYGQGENVVTKREAPKYGLELIHSQAFPGGTTDLTPYVNKLKSLDPDFITSSAFFFDGVNFIRTFKEQNYCPRGYWFGAQSDEFLTEMKKDGDYDFTTLFWDESVKMPRGKEVVEKFRKQFGLNMDGYVALGYTCTYVLKDALERAASTDADKLRKALAETDLPHERGNFMPSKGGRIQFDENGENKSTIMMGAQVLNQKRGVIWPPEYKTAEPVFPVPKWSERK